MRRHPESRHPESRPLCFSNVHLPKFERRTCALSMRYILVFVQLGLSGLLVLAEIFVATSLILHKTWVQRVMHAGFDRSQPAWPLEISEPHAHPSVLSDVFERTSIAAGWITVASLGLTICVTVRNWMQAKSVVKSDSILQAFLSSPAFQLWTIKSYTHFCLLSDIKWGRSLRQRIVLTVYFGLQGFGVLLVALPRVTVYACVVYAASNLPGMGTTASGFQQLGFSSNTGHDGWPLMVTLGIMVLSTVFHTLKLIRIVVSATMCVFSLCYLRRIKRAMARDIEFRITSLVVSRCGAADTNRSDSGDRSSAESYKLDMELRLDHTTRGTKSAPNAFDQDSPVNEIAEKPQFRHTQDSALYRSGPKRVNIPQLDLSQGVNANEESTGLDLYARSAATPLACYSRKDEDVAMIPQHQHYASLYGEDNGMGGSVPSIGIQAEYLPSSTTIPLQRTTAINGSAGAAEYVSRLPYGNKMAALSFYDDLLATISSERMIYTTSLSNRRRSAPLLQPCHSTEQGVKMDRNNSVLSLQSSALCSSIHLTYGSSDENDERSILSRPVHPFDITDLPETSVRLLPRSPTLLKDCPNTSINNTLVQHSDTLDIGNGFQMGLSSGAQSQENLQKQNTYTAAQKRSSRCGSSHSQDIIENWRIHVAPSPPTIPELYDDDHDTVTDRASTPTGNQNGYRSWDIGMDINLHNNIGCSDRRGTIPIILSSHLQDARTTNFVEEQYFFSAQDLEAPRPPYAYGQTRTQRQGSVNSSIGGYNYSTAASSPSLADSLSNPMYQEQSFGIMSSSTMLKPRSLAPRKGSLPTSLCNRPIVDDFRLPPGTSQLYSQQHSSVGPPSAVSRRIRSNMPSQLSNMITHSGNTAGYGLDVDYIHTPVDGEQVQILPQHQRGHVRSQSQGARSSGSSWDQVGIEKVKAGCTTLMDIPTVTPSHMGYYTLQEDLFSSYPALRSSGIMGSREDLTINNGSANFSRNIFEPVPSRGEGQEYSLSKIYRNDMSDNMVHPLDLSPLLPQTHSGSKREFNRSDAVANNGGEPRQDRAWDDTCVGLGLTFDLDSSMPDSSDNEGSIFIRYPHERLAMASSVASGFMTHTGHLHQASYPETYTSMDMPTATMGNIFDDYPPPMSTNTVDTSPASENRRGRPPQVQRQSSQRNKKNLIVNIVPLQAPL